MTTPATGGPTLVRDALADQPALVEALRGRPASAWVVDCVASLRGSVPTPPSCESFAEGTDYRPPLSYRAFYRSRLSVRSPERTDPGRGVVAIKGSEPLAADFGHFLRRFSLQPKSPGGFVEQRRMGEHFALAEHKVLGVFTMAEAEAEYAIALEVQRRHLAAYGALAPVPLPLLLYRHADELVAGVTAQIRGRLSAAAFDRIEPLLARGLGIYCYHYPSHLVRINQLPPLLSPEAAPLRSAIDAGAVTESWVRLVARLFYLGYVPATLGSLGLGSCLREWNVIADGGFVDLDSVTPIERAIDDAALVDDLHLTVVSLTRTVYRFLVADRGRGDLPMDHGLARIGDHVRARLEAALDSERRPGLELDPRIARYFATPPDFTALVADLRSYYTRPRLPARDPSSGTTVAPFPEEQIGMLLAMAPELLLSR